MLGIENAVAAIASRLDVPPPAPGDDGGFRFELADGMDVSVIGLPGGVLVAWSGLGAGGHAPDEGEARAARLLRLRLARLRRHGAVVASLGEDGQPLLHIRLAPNGEQEWLDAVAELLNEAEAMRKALSREDGRPGNRVASLFSGMGGLSGK